MARSSSTDPVRNFKFQVQIIPSAGGLTNHVGPSIGKLGFAVVSGLSVQNEMIAYREGGMNTHPHKMIGQSDFAPVTFSKGVFGHEKALYQWQTFLHSWSQGGQGGGSVSGNNDYRCDIVVSVFDHPVSSGSYATPGDTENAPTPAGQAKLAFKLFNCWPGSYSLTDLNAGDSSIMIQQMVINHEGFHIEWSPSANGSVNVQALAGIG
jgi:phage tail-like protein